MKIKIKKIIDLQTLLMWLGLLCVVSFALLEHVSISIAEFSAVKMPLLYVGGICAIPLLKIFLSNVRKKRYFYIFLTLFALCAVLLVSAEYNSNTVSGYSPARTTYRLVLYLLELFVLMMAFAEKGKSQAVLKFVFWYLVLLVLLADVLMLTGWITFGTKQYPAYLVGTKFTVIYMHYNLLTMWLIQRCDKKGGNSVTKKFLWIAAGVLSLIAIYVDCMSGVLGSIFLAWLIVRQKSSRKATKLMATPLFLVTCILLCTLIAFVIGFFLDIPFVSAFVEDVLGRDTTLTGRIKIYQSYIETMENHWLFGYGYGSGSQISVQNFGCTNAQNAVLHWILQCGLAVSTLLITLFSLIMKQVKAARIEMRKNFEFLVALIYTYIMLGIVEITYSMAFILFMALIFMTANDKKVNEPVSNDQKLE